MKCFGLINGFLKEKVENESFMSTNSKLFKDLAEKVHKDTANT